MKRTVFARALICCLLLTLALPVAAGPNRWTSNGPEGAEIAALLVPSSDPGTIYAMASGGTLFRSATAGELSWIAVSSSLPSDAERVVLASNPENANLLYAAVPGQDSRTLRLFRSLDRGRTWSENPDLIPGILMDLAFVSEQVGFLATLDGLLVTRDGGATWVRSRSGSHRTVAVRNGNVYIGGGGIIVSTDLGASWRQISGQGYGFAISPSGQTMVRGGTPIERSRDGGATWQPLPSLPIQGLSPTSLVPTDDRLFVTTSSEGVYAYDENRRKWSSVATLPRSRETSGVPVKFAAAPTGHIYAGMEAGVFVLSGSSDDQWRIAVDGMSQAASRSIALDGDDNVYVATARGLFKSEDAAASWRHVEGIASPRSISVSGDTTYVASSEGIQRSVDDGASWSVVTPREARWVGSSSMSPATLYASFSAGLERSRDGGNTWTSTAPSPVYFNYAAVDPNDSERIYVHGIEGWGSRQGFLRSDVGGGSWTPVFGQGLNDYSISAFAVNGSILHLALDCRSGRSSSFGCGITSTTNGGVTWSVPTLSDETIMALAIDPTRPWRSYAGTRSGRVYRSDDFGAEWTPFGEGLTTAAVRQLAVSGSGDRIYAGTAGGVYVYEITQTVELERLPDDPQRLPRLMDQLLAVRGGGSDSLGASGLLIPAAGRVRGSSGVTFHTDMTLANGSATDQDVFVAWLPQGNSAGANVSSFRITLPAANEDNDGVLTLDDLADDLGLDGLGSLLVFAVDGAGNVDGNAEIDGFARIRSRSECGGWVSQSLAAVPADAFTTSRRSQAIGLRHEPSYRTNVGVVNLSASARDFTVIAKGEGAREQFTITVPPFAPLLTAIPNRNYGAVSLTVIGDGNSAPSVSYGSSVDNTSGDAWTAMATPRRTP